MDENNLPLDTLKSEIFHSIVVKLLYIAKIRRSDIEVAVSFLCNRVSKSTKDDWITLRRILGYLKSTIDDTRIIGAENMQDLYA